MKRFQSKHFAFIAAILIAIQLLAACAPGTSIPAATGPATQPPAVETGIIPETGATEAPTEHAMTTEAAAATDPLVFKQAMHRLWEDHIQWTRVYLVSAIAELPDTEAAAGRLLKNQEDIGNAIKPFYGDEAGEQLTALLKEHITIAVDLVNAAKAGDSAKLEDANTRWSENADQIGTFLSAANADHWPEAEMQAMMKTHLDLTLEEATARLNGDYAADIAAYDKVHDAMLEMSDMLADGIIMQFPDQFAEQTDSQAQIDLTLAMDKLWEDHIIWTRMYVISAAADLPDAEATAGRLLKNQEDIGNAIKPVYGEDAGNQLTALLKEHITIAVDLVSAAKAGDTAKVEDANARWTENANQIGTFLSTANPDNWPEGEMQDMLNTHLELTLEEATARLNGDWEADIAAYEKVHTAMLEMSNMLTKGIVAQFPDKFQ
jgi:hypothetical protein